MHKFDVIIIGGGLGGLLCANILSREGMNVCLFEKNKKLGGCIQSFSKEKTIFNTGLNYTESLGEGEVLNKYFKYFKIMDKLKLKQLDKDAFTKISFGEENTEYPLAQKDTNFINRLSEYFPDNSKNLQSYLNRMKEICNSFGLYSINTGKDSFTDDIFTESTFKYLQSVTPDKRLQNVLAGLNILYGGVPEKTPLYIHSLINYSFIQSAWRLVGGSSHLATAITGQIKNNGGQIFTSTKVISIEGENKKVNYVKLENGEIIYANKIISNIHPSDTLKMASSNLSNKVYRKRIISLDNTVGMFTVYIVLKKEAFPYLNYNHHHYKTNNVWTADYNVENWPEHYYLYTPAQFAEMKWAKGLILMTYMKYSEVKKWKNSFTGERGKDYEEFKIEQAEKLINMAEQKFPALRKSIKNYYTSTPLTYRDYTGTPEGSSYGILKDYNNPYSTIITPKSRIKNLFFTGQNLNLHGILGVSVGAITTCSKMLDYNYLIKKIQGE